MLISLVAIFPSLLVVFVRDSGFDRSTDLPHPNQDQPLTPPLDPFCKCKARGWVGLTSTLLLEGSNRFQGAQIDLHKKMDYVTYTLTFQA